MVPEGVEGGSCSLIYWNEAQHSLNKDPCTDRDKTE